MLAFALNDVLPIGLAYLSLSILQKASSYLDNRKKDDAIKSA